jgi:uncharacterized phage protein gp47/JayE
METTQAEIEQIIIQYKEQQPELQGLTNPTNSAIWRMLVKVYAFIAWQLTLKWQALATQLRAEIKTARVGTVAWWSEVLRAYQQGDVLTVINGVPTYATIDPTKQIVKRVAVVSTTPGVVTVKAAKLGPGGQPQKLADPVELDPFTAYAIARAPIGTQVLVPNLEGDDVNITATIYYNATAVLGEVQLAAQAAIEAYLRNIDFNGRYELIRLVDAIQLSLGVLDVTITNVTITPDGGSPTVNPRQYVFEAGYAKMPTLNLSYVPQQPL